MPLIHLLFLLPFLLFSGGLHAGEAPLETEAVRYRDVLEERLFDGAVEAVHQATVSSQTAGRIQSIEFDVNDMVRKGEVIVRLRDKDQRSELAAAEAGLNEARASLNQAAKEYRRIKSIFDQKLIAKSALDKADAVLKSAQARVRAAQARVAKAKENLARTVVRAPYSGIVVKRLVEVGEMAAVGTPLMQGLSLEKLRVLTHVPQRLVYTVRGEGGAKVIYEAADGKSRTIPVGRVTVFPQADPVSHAFPVRLDLPESDYGLYPGMFVKVAVGVGRKRHLMVLEKALVRRSEVTGVYVVDAQGRVSLRQVRVGRHHDGRVEVLAGLSEGEKYALDPIEAGVRLKQQSGARK